MTAQDYFSVGREISPQPSPSATPYSPITPNQDEPAAPRRIYLRTSALHAEYSPGHRAVSFSSWTRYSTSPITAPSGQLKASVLCKASGTSPSYDPPVSEWAFLGAGQPITMTGKPEVREKWSDWRQRRSPGGSPLSTKVGEEGSEGIDFRKRPIKRVSIESQLTRSIKTGSETDFETEKATMAAKKNRLEGLTCDDLPSAFDSDSEDDYI